MRYGGAQVEGTQYSERGGEAGGTAKRWQWWYGGGRNGRQAGTRRERVAAPTGRPVVVKGGGNGHGRRTEWFRRL